MSSSRFTRRVVRLLVTALAGVVPAMLVADEAKKPAEDPAGIAFFETKIRPVLVDHCYKCHSAKENSSEGGLLLDSKESARIGGDRGPAVVPGKPDESVLLTAISHTDPDLKMPPRERLPDSVIADFKKWIEMGAPDPRETGATQVTKRTIDLEAGRQFWSFQPPRDYPIPQTKNPGWAKRDLDHFILAKLEEAGLAPSPDAALPTLLRRLYFDLIGLPPSPAALDEFLARVESKGLDAALEVEVDTLLASKYFGERWGRHWMDVARFAESSGKEANISFPHAWRYRDYVIDSINEDMPFDRFIVEQIAGDQLPYDSDAERARLLIATGFLALGPKNLEEGNELQFRADLIDEQIDTVTRAIMAQSVACARCHDHKFDPFAMQDYYALAGIFASTKTYFGTAVSPANRVAGDPLPLPRVEGQLIFHKGIPAQRVESLKKELAALTQEQEAGMAKIMKAIAAGEDASEIFTIQDALRIFWRRGAIEGELETVDDSGNPLPLAMGVLDSNKIIDSPIFERGDISKPGQKVSRGFTRVVKLENEPPIPSDRSGRLEFARWLTDPSHPLTARVAVNRIWHYLFGAGLVRSVDNFGTTGEKPSHPELLDHLTVKFIENGWSLKSTVRQIVLSRTYRQSSTYNEASFLKDPDNRLLWRAEKRRLEAEAIRDAMLEVAGELDTARPAGSLVARMIGDRPISLIGLDKRIPADLDGARHRSLYLPILRDRLPDILELFDFAEASLVTGERETTNVPVQALYLMNSPFVHERAKGLAGRLTREADSIDERIKTAFRLCYSRPPDAAELDMGKNYLDRGVKLAGEDAQLREQVLVSYCQALLCTAEFRNLD